MKNFIYFCNMNYIIGIAGQANSGKDTIADMLNYIFLVGIAKANYVQYMARKKAIIITHGSRIIHFADPLKDVISILYGIERQLLNERDYKNFYWYCLDTGQFCTTQEANYVKNPNFIEWEQLYINSLKDCIKPKYFNYIKIRTLLQYIGTDLCRLNLDNDIWVKATMRKAVDIAEAKKLCIIPDVRFPNEAAAIHKDSNSSLYGGIIKVNRDVPQIEYSSEIIDFDIDYTIENNGTLANLFYKVLQIVNVIMDKNES